jgi:hypothetical protein
MKLNELTRKEVRTALAIGKHENIIFDHIEYRTDRAGDITGIYVHVEKFKPLFLPFFDEDNYQLDLLLEQLGIESYDPEEINKAKGTVIIVHRYERVTDKDTFVNVSFNPRYIPNNEQDIFA